MWSFTLWRWLHWACIYTRDFYNGLRSLGLYHERYSGWARRLSKVFAIIVSVVFALMPIYIYLRG